MGEFPSKFKLKGGHKCRLAILGLSSADSQTSWLFQQLQPLLSAFLVGQVSPSPPARLPVCRAICSRWPEGAQLWQPPPAPWDTGCLYNATLLLKLPHTCLHTGVLSWMRSGSWGGMHTGWRKRPLFQKRSFYKLCLLGPLPWTTWNFLLLLKHISIKHDPGSCVPRRQDLLAKQWKKTQLQVKIKEMIPWATKPLWFSNQLSFIK